MNDAATFHDERTGLRIVPAHPAHLRRIGASMRHEDEREARALHGRSPHLALEDALSVSKGTWYAEVHGKPLALFGYVPMKETDEPRSAVVWMVGTEEISRSVRAIIVGTRWWLPQVMEGFPGGLGNVMDAGNLVHVRWMAKAGATFDPTRLIQRRGRYFVPFVLTPELLNV